MKILWSRNAQQGVHNPIVVFRNNYPPISSGLFVPEMMERETRCRRTHKATIAHPFRNRRTPKLDSRHNYHDETRRASTKPSRDNVYVEIASQTPPHASLPPNNVPW